MSLVLAVDIGTGSCRCALYNRQMYSSAKIAWWREHRPDLFNRIDTFVSAKAFVLQRLTGILLEDRATVSGSVLGAAAYAYHTLGMMDSFRYLLERNPIIHKVRPKAKAREFYQIQFKRYMHLYWKFQKEFD